MNMTVEPSMESIYTSSILNQSSPLLSIDPAIQRKAFAELGKAIVSVGSLFPKTKRARKAEMVTEEPIYSINTYRQMYERIDIAKSIIDRTAEFVMQTAQDLRIPQHLRQANTKLEEVKGLKENIQFIRQWQRYIGFKSKMTELLVSGFWAGDGYMEIVMDEESDWKIVELKALEPDEIRVIRGKKGDVLGYVQFPFKSNMLMPLSVRGARSFISQGAVFFETNEILHFKWNPFPSAPYGTSMMESLKDILALLVSMREDIGLIIRNFAAPLVIFRLGTELIPASAQTITDFSTWLRNQLTDSNNLVTSTLVQPDVIAGGDKTLNIGPYFDQMLRLLYGSVGLPEIMLGQGNDTTEATAKIQLETASRRFRNIQQTLRDQVELRLFPMLCKNVGDPENLTPADMDSIPEMWFAPFESEEDKRIRLENGFRFGYLTRQETRKEFGFIPEHEGDLHPDSDPEHQMKLIKERPVGAFGQPGGGSGSPSGKSGSGGGKSGSIQQKPKDRSTASRQKTKSKSPA